MKLAPPLQRSEFRTLWSAGLISDAGDWLLLIALPIVVYNLTGSAFGTSVAFLVELAPGILLAPLAGWYADRWNRRRLLLAVCLLQALALLPLLAVTSRGDLPILYAVILTESALFALFAPAKNALLPTLVPSSELVSANSLVGLNENLGRLVGGPLGGLLLAAAGLRLIVVVDVATYLLSAVLISRLASGAEARAEHRSATRHSPAPGSFVSILAARRTRSIVVVAFTAAIAQGIFVVLFVLFVAQRLHGGSAEIGLLRGVQAIGAIGGGLALTALSRRCSPATLTAWAATAFGVIDLVVWNAPSLTTVTAIYIALFILIGAPGIAMATGMISSLQLATTDAERGRAFSGFGMVMNVGQAIGMVAAGVLTSVVGLMSMLNSQAVVYLAAGLIAALSLPRRRVRSVRRRRPQVPQPG